MFYSFQMLMSALFKVRIVVILMQPAITLLAVMTVPASLDSMVMDLHVKVKIEINVQHCCIQYVLMQTMMSVLIVLLTAVMIIQLVLMLLGVTIVTVMMASEETALIVQVS